MYITRHIAIHFMNDHKKYFIIIDVFEVFTKLLSYVKKCIGLSSHFVDYNAAYTYNKREK